MESVRTPDILVIAAMKEELKEFQGADAVYPLNHSSGKPDKRYWELPEYSCRIGFNVCGVGKKSATKNISALLKKVQPEKILVTGYSGSLVPALDIGDVVIIEKTVHNGLSPDAFVSMDDQLISLCKTVFDNHGITFSLVSAVSSDTFIDATSDKIRLRDRFEAGCADMESHSIALLASSRQISILMIRVISDLADETIGLDFSRIPAGKWPFRLYFLRHPWLLPRLHRMYRNANKARHTLSNAVHILLEELYENI
jgi:nucleoside phosphorylase